MAMAAYLELMEQRVQDTDSRLSTDDFSRALRSAVIKYSADCPRQVVADVTANGSSVLPLPPGFDANTDAIASIEYPIGSFPPNMLEGDCYQLLPMPLGVELRLANAIPATSPVRVMRAAPHLLDATNDTIPSKHLDAVADWAASLLCHDLATLYSGDSDPTISADSVSHANKSSAFAARSRTLAQRYYDAIGVDPKRNNAAGVVVSMTVTPSHGAQRLTHYRGFYRG